MKHPLQIHFFSKSFTANFFFQWKLILLTLKINNLSKNDSHKKNHLCSGSTTGNLFYDILKLTKDIDFQ